MGKYVDFFFTYSGTKTIALKDKISHISDIDVVIILNSPGCSIQQRPGEHKRALSYMVYPEVLIDSFGLNINIMPKHIAAALLRRDNRPMIIKLRLPPRVHVSLESIFDNHMKGAIFEKYIYAKAEEFVCEAVNLLNKMLFIKNLHLNISEKHALEQKIEAAAYIYRQNIGNRITVEDLCKKIGVNRNILNSGFKDMFGQSPAEYARSQTLEWARTQIIEGNHSIKALSDVAGYSNISAFSRAYSSYFGISPTKTPK